MNILRILLLAAGFCCLSLTAVAGPVTIAGTEVKTLYSKQVGQQYKLLVNLPAGYDPAHQHYPVLYLLDAQWDFPLVSAIYGEQYYDGFVPAMIIIGVTWGGKDPNPDVLRRRDFTPTDVDGGSGGADKFLAFFRKELIPFVNQHYATSDTRALAGSSLGGLFTLYSYLTQPDLFNLYLPTSPAVSWDNGALYKSAPKPANRDSRGSRKMYIAYSELEELKPAVRTFIEFLTRQRYRGLQWTYHQVNGTGHSGVKAEGVTKGLQYLFSQPEVTLSEPQLARLAGRYRSANGTELILTGQQGRLLGKTADGAEHVLVASSPLRFHQRGEFFKVRFVAGRNGGISGFYLTRYSRAPQLFKRQ